MSRIQELPDDFNSSNPLPPSTETPFPISTKPKAQDASSTTTPSLPPAMDSVRSHTTDEIVNMMKRTPLFMTNLDEAAGVDGEENYRSTLTDTSHTLSLSPTNTKAHYRSTLALLALSKHTLALDTCARGLALTSPTLISTNIATKPSPEHLAFRSLQSRILAAKQEADEKEAKKVTAEERRKKEQLTLNAAISARGIKVRWTGKQPDLEDASVCLRPDPLSPTSEVFWPVLVLYPLVGESDFLKGVGETALFAEILVTVLGEGVGWDGGGEYVLDGVGSGGGGGGGGGGEGNKKKGVDVFMETKEGGMVKVGRKMRLLDVLAGGKVEVVDGVVRFFVVPRAKVEGWVEGMKGRKGKGVGS
ncbi:MAG: hypothetical protein L6R42_009199 [Xanthoria sp. 1 TBL-2021]|nr:MAG: hypothetical protein L6R42_009199 [Xanthoria sp. 1 TBL-2021]